MEWSGKGEKIKSVLCLYIMEQISVSYHFLFFLVLRHFHHQKFFGARIVELNETSWNSFCFLRCGQQQYNNM